MLGATMLAGRGGVGGSGGSILIQTFAAIAIAQGVSFDTSGGKPGDSNGDGLVNLVLDAEGGQGGSGVVQLEDASANFVTAFNNSAVNGEALTQVFISGANVEGLANSRLIDTLSTAPDYTAATASIVTSAGGTVTVRLIGVAEDPLDPGQPASSAVANDGQPLMVGPVDLAQIDQLDGFRWFQFLIEVHYPNGQIQQSTMLPYLESLQVDWID